MKQFRRFCLVGGLGFVVDSFCFAILIAFIDSLMLPRAVSFCVAASATWLLNRLYTYRHLIFDSIFHQWLKHMLACSLTGAINLLVFYSALAFMPIAVAFCLGILVGLFSNYYLSRRFVFSAA